MGLHVMLRCSCGGGGVGAVTPGVAVGLACTVAQKASMVDPALARDETGSVQSQHTKKRRARWMSDLKSCKFQPGSNSNALP